MNKIWLIFCLAGLNSHSAQNNLYNLKNIANICVNIAKKLSNSKITSTYYTKFFNNNRAVTLERPALILNLANQNIIFMCEIINTNSQTLINIKKSWHILSFGTNNTGRLNNYNLPMGMGLELWQENKKTRCSIKKLRSLYQDTIKLVTNNWQLKISKQDKYRIILTNKFANFFQADLLFKNFISWIRTRDHITERVWRDDYKISQNNKTNNIKIIIPKNKLLLIKKHFGLEFLNRSQYIAQQN